MSDSSNDLLDRMYEDNPAKKAAGILIERDPNRSVIKIIENFITENKTEQTNGELAALIFEKYIERTKKHVALVKLCASYLKPFFDKLGYTEQFFRQIENHDGDKFMGNEHMALYAIRYAMSCCKDVVAFDNKATELFWDIEWPEHYKKNSHHPEHYMHVSGMNESATDNETRKWTISDEEMDEFWSTKGGYPAACIALGEMVADWMSVGLEHNNKAANWWELNKNKRWSWGPKYTAVIEELLSMEPEKIYTDIDFSNENFRVRDRAVANVISHIPEITDVVELKKQLKPGDLIVAYRKRSMMGVFPALFNDVSYLAQGSSFTTIKIVSSNVDVMYGFGIVFGDTAFNKADTLKTLSTFGGVVVLHNPKLTAADVAKIDAECEKCIKNVVYDYSKRIESVFGHMFLAERKTKNQPYPPCFCSTIFVHMFNKLGIPTGLAYTHTDTVWPKDFMIHSNWKPTYSYFANGEDPQYALKAIVSEEGWFSDVFRGRQKYHNLMVIQDAQKKSLDVLNYAKSCLSSVAGMCEQNASERISRLVAYSKRKASDYDCKPQNILRIITQDEIYHLNKLDGNIRHEDVWLPTKGISQRRSLVNNRLKQLKDIRDDYVDASKQDLDIYNKALSLVDKESPKEYAALIKQVLSARKTQLNKQTAYLVPLLDRIINEYSSDLNALKANKSSEELAVSEEGLFGSEQVTEKDETHYIIRDFPVLAFYSALKKEYKTTKLEHIFNSIGMSWLATTFAINKRTVVIHKFFVPELLYLLNKFDFPQGLISTIRSSTWVGRANPPTCSVDMTRIEKNMKVDLYPHQREFIERYPANKDENLLRGYLLSFDQGLGKTITALALMEALGKKHVVIVCPKNTMLETWVAHINNFYKRTQSYWVAGARGTLTPNYKFYIYNYDRIEEAHEFLLNNNLNNVGIIVDESHNFLRVSSKRTKYLMDLAVNLKNTDILLQSGTPLKAHGIEMLPIMRVLDPMFDDEAESIFKRTFGLNTVIANDVLHARLDRMMTRVTKAILDLPTKTEKVISVKMATGNKYTVTTVKKGVADFVNERKAYYRTHMAEYEAAFDECVAWLSRQPQFKHDREFAQWLETIDWLRSANVSDARGNQMIVWANQYENEVIVPALPDDLKKKFLWSRSAVKYVALKIKGEVIGSYLMHLRMQMTSEMLEAADIKSIVDNSVKKTIVFTSYVDTIESAKKYFEANGYKPLCVYGKTASELTETVATFQTKAGYNPLIASLKMIATGATLTAANTVIFLNKPWRSIEYQQASDRVHRIGQDTPCFIYSLVLDTGKEENLSTRMEEIMNWSGDQFEQIVGKQEYMKLRKQFGPIALFETVKGWFSRENLSFEALQKEELPESVKSKLGKYLYHGTHRDLDIKHLAVHTCKNRANTEIKAPVVYMTRSLGLACLHCAEFMKGHASKKKDYCEHFVDLDTAKDSDRIIKHVEIVHNDPDLPEASGENDGFIYCTETKNCIDKLYFSTPKNKNDYLFVSYSPLPVDKKIKIHITWHRKYDETFAKEAKSDKYAGVEALSYEGYEPLDNASTEGISPKVEKNIVDNKVYHCSPVKYDVLKKSAMGKWYTDDKKGIFVTPFKGIAACFVISKRDIIDKLEKQGCNTHNINFKYDVWNKKPEELSDVPKKIIVTVQGAGDYKPIKGTAKGYLYTIDYSKYKDKTSMFSKNKDSDVEFIINSDITPESVEEITVNYEVVSSSSSTEAQASGPSKIALKKKKILDFICKLCDTMEPSGLNSKRYRGMIEKMSDKEFDQFMNYMKEGKWQLNLIAPNMIVNLRNEDLLKACDLIGLDLFQRIWIHDRATGKKYLTDNKYMFLQLPIRRQQQFLDEKMRVPDDDRTIDQLSGQVTGDSRACAITTPEIHILAARGLSETLQELVNVRGGNIANYNEFRRSLEETGEADLDALDPNSRTRSSVVATKLLQSMMLDTNL